MIFLYHETKKGAGMATVAAGEIVGDLILSIHNTISWRHERYESSQSLAQ